MTELKCHVIHCSSNKDQCCCRPEIKVDGEKACTCDETCCASFTKIPEGVTNDVGYKAPNCHMPIECDAKKCVYNESGKCAADCICVDGSNAKDMNQTVCSTFKCE